MDNENSRQNVFYTKKIYNNKNFFYEGKIFVI